MFEINMKNFNTDLEFYYFLSKAIVLIKVIVEKYEPQFQIQGCKQKFVQIFIGSL